MSKWLRIVLLAVPIVAMVLAIFIQTVRYERMSASQDEARRQVIEQTLAVQKLREAGIRATAAAIANRDTVMVVNLAILGFPTEHVATVIAKQKSNS